MTKLLEAIFRSIPRLLIMLLVPTIIGLGVAYIFPRTYQASATLWALKRYEIISTTGTESNLQATLAQTQATALAELLQSRTFDIVVAKSTNLRSILKLSQNAPSLDDAYGAEISKNVKVTARGTNLYEVTYTSSDGRIATQVVASVVKEFQLQGEGFSVLEGQRLLQADQNQLSQAQADANAAAQKESAYLGAHPNATVGNDPQYALLDSQRAQAQSTLQSIQSTIATLSQELAIQNTGGDTFFRTLDPPIVPQATSRTKLLLTTGGVGAALGLVTCVIYILILVRRDRTFYNAIDVEKATSYPILVEVPLFPEATKELSLTK